MCVAAQVYHRRRNRAKTINIAACLVSLSLILPRRRVICGTAAIIGRGGRAAALIGAAGCSSGLRAPRLPEPDKHPWLRKQLRTPGALPMTLAVVLGERRTRLLFLPAQLLLPLFDCVAHCLH